MIPHIKGFGNKTVLTQTAPRIIRRLIIPHVDHSLATSMCSAKFNIDPVPLTGENSRLGDIGNRERVVEWRTIDESKSRFVRIGEEANESEKHVPKVCMSFRKRFVRNSVIRRQQLTKKFSRHDGGMSDIERNHSLFDRSIKHNLCSLSCKFL